MALNTKIQMDFARYLPKNHVIYCAKTRLIYVLNFKYIIFTVYFSRFHARIYLLLISLLKYVLGRYT